MVQVYGGAPQFLGFFLEIGKWGEALRVDRSGVISLGASSYPWQTVSRNSSGTAIYNRMIYGQLDIQDQIAPFQGETFLDFHVVGLFLGFAFLGWLAFKLQTAFAQSTLPSKFSRGSTSPSGLVFSFLEVWLSSVKFLFTFAGHSICTSSIDDCNGVQLKCIATSNKKLIELPDLFKPLLRKITR